MKRIDISKLQKNRTMYFKLGLIFSLSLVIYAFSWTTSPIDFPEQEIEIDPYIENEIIRTADQKKPIPPPQKVKPTEEFIPDESPEFIEEPIKDIKSDVVDQKKMIDFLNDHEIVETEPIPRPVEPEIDVPSFFKHVEEMPRFAGCKEDGLTKKERKKCAEKMLYAFMAKKLRYPAMARENNIEGVVIIRFIVEKDGSISDTEIVRAIGGGCEQEALRVVKEMPNWLPGKQAGRPVRVQFNLPVRFRLN